MSESDNDWTATPDYMRELHKDQLHALQLCGSEALAKACVDEFDYALKLDTGEIFRFTARESSIAGGSILPASVKAARHGATSAE